MTTLYEEKWTGAIDMVSVGDGGPSFGISPSHSEQQRLQALRDTLRERLVRARAAHGRYPFPDAMRSEILSGRLGKRVRVVLRIELIDDGGAT